jgi:uroporphyrinogen decarboxylase
MDATERFLNACYGRPVDRPPVWIMRQAGRYMDTYQAVRKQHSFLEVCKTPELACKVTMMPIDQLEPDAAILFCDIMVPMEVMGLDLDFRPGPHLDPPVRTMRDVEALKVDGVCDELGYVYDAIRVIKDTLNQRVPLLGFAGSPFTLACYSVEGSTTRHHHHIKKMMLTQPEVLEALLGKLADVVAEFLGKQIDAGVQGVQLFDTWGGILDEANWRRFSLPFAKRIFESLEDRGVPRIFYIQNGSHLLHSIKEMPCEVLSVDWRQSLSEVRRIVGPKFALQGNLDPALMTTDTETIRTAVKAFFDDLDSTQGIVVNLGHGITPDATLPAAQALVNAVKEFGPKAAK